MVDGLIWAIGGRDPRSLARVDIYNPAMDTWKPGPELPAPTSGAAEGVINGVIFIYGGEEPNFIEGGINDRHWMFDTRGASPQWEPAPAPPLAVHGADGAVLHELDGHSWRLNPAWSPLAHRLVERAAADEARGAPKINSSGGSEGYSPLCISSWTGCAPFVI